MDWHTISADDELEDANKFESESMKKVGLIGEIAPRYRTTYFAHILVDTHQVIIAMFTLPFLTLMHLKHSKKQEMSLIQNFLQN